jgi:hypothetical protein
MLLKKYKRAEVGRSESDKAYTGLADSLDHTIVSQWKVDEETAMIERGESLRIFEVKLNKGN